MKRVVIFYFSYKGNENIGQKMTKKTYSIFKRKSSIVNDFFDWTKEELSAVQEIHNDKCIITDIQIIGL